MKQKPIRLFEGSTKPHEAFWRVRDVADTEGEDTGTEIEFYGYISEYSWFDDDITPAMFKQDLYGAGRGGPVTIRINSGGGDVFAASVIRATLIDYPGKVTVKIDGLAASAATVVAMAGDRIMMNESAYFMIHDPWMLAMGNIEEIKASLEMLKTIKDGIIDTYQNRTRIGTEKLSTMMRNETWMTAREAQEFGFIDDVIIGGQKSGAKGPAANTAFINAITVESLKNYHNVPADLINLLRPVGQQEPTAEKQDCMTEVSSELKYLALGGL